MLLIAAGALCGAHQAGARARHEEVQRQCSHCLAEPAAGEPAAAARQRRRLCPGVQLVPHATSNACRAALYGPAMHDVVYLIEYIYPATRAGDNFLITSFEPLWTPD